MLMNAPDIINLPVLVLNQNYEPLNVCRVRRAVILIYNGKAEMMEDGSGFIHSADANFHVPSVIRLASQVKHPRPQRKLTRLEVFHRDGFTCQYCGKQTHQLTLDHVMPRYRGGQNVWQNVVSACVSCNMRKAGRTPAEAGMILRNPPAPPRGDSYFFLSHNYGQVRSQWQKYLPAN
jgi:5-methylcytosine-specific restriction endonuclease McrA